jgi:uncharacterized protein YeaO (DUF488 family)
LTFRGDSVYSRDGAEGGGLRVLVMRLWPRGVRKDRIDVWLKDAAPSRELLDAYHRGAVAWDEFEAAYRREILEDRPEVVDTLRALAREHPTITLLCFERIPPAEHCHRQTLLAMLGEGDALR